MSNWNLSFCRLKRVWLQAKFVEVSHFFLVSDAVPIKDRDAAEDILPNKIIKNELDDIVYSTVLKRETHLSLYDVMKFRYLTVRNGRIPNVDSHKYRQKS